MTINDYKPRYVKLSTAASSLEQIGHFSGVDKLIKFREKQGLRYPFLANDYYLSLIDSKDEQDPLRKMVVPSIKELKSYADRKKGSLDTSGEQTNWKAPGLQHKYEPTALAIISHVCGGLCRHCFRKRLFIVDAAESQARATFPTKEGLDYLAEHKEIDAVLLSGGDSFMLTDDAIDEILSFFCDPRFDHISTIRFGTKMPAYYPARITEQLASMLARHAKRLDKTIMVAVHYEHPNELTEESLDALRLLHDHGLVVYNQTVLLKGINDDPGVLVDLFERLAKVGTRPYYLFQDRPVKGSMDLQVTLKQGAKLFREVLRRLTGVHKPRYAMSTKIGKLEILGINPKNEDEVVLRRHSSKKGELTGELFFYDVKKNDPRWYYPKE